MEHRYRGLAKLAKYLKTNKLGKASKKYHTKHTEKDGANRSILDKMDDFQVDCLYLNNLMVRLRQWHIQSGETVLEEHQFDQYILDCSNKKRAKVIRTMLIGSSVPWWSYHSKEFAKVGAKHTKDIMEAYDRAEHIWKGIEMHSEIKDMWEELQTILHGHDDDGAYMWPIQAKWRLDDRKTIVVDDENALTHLAPLQQQVAAEVGEETNKELVGMMNDIIQRVATISLVDDHGERKLLEDVKQPLHHLLQARVFFLYL